MRAKATAITFGVFLLAALTGPVAGAAPTGEWHRLNPGVTNEHERLRCVEVSPTWVCRYDKLPEPGFQLDGTVGIFHGRNITTTWTCPEWFAGEICDNVRAVYEGRATYLIDGGHPFHSWQDYIITDMAGQPVLIQYWVDQFACPWFRTFDEAVDANPGSVFDCVFAP
jgi:hypothetical protein